MKKLNVLFTLLLLHCCLATAKAEEVTIDGIRYDVVTKGKVAKVTGGGNYTGAVVIPETIVHNNVTCSVTSIGDSAFKGCTGLTSVVIGDSVTIIGDYAFKGCTELTSVVIGNSVTTIRYEAFYNCYGLTSVVIGNSVTCICYDAFRFCDSLKEVHISDIAAWCNISFGDSDANPLYYAENLYLNGNLVTELIIPNGVTNIGDYVFIGCSGLTSITIPNSVTSIGYNTFDDYAGWSTFLDCSGLTKIIVAADNSVYDSRNNCNAIIKTESNTLITGCKNTIIPNSVKSIGGGAFYNCSGLTGITIPNSVTSIGGYAFYNCSGLTSIEIPNSVTNIGSWAFYGCSSLTSVTIGNSVTSIGSSAFKGCTGLTSITIGSGIKEISLNAFEKCENLADVYCLATTVPSTGIEVFSGSYPEYMTLHVPAEAINLYKTTWPWSSFGNIVTLNGGTVVTPKCANPVISYKNGQIEIECATADAKFITTVKNDYAGTYYSNNFGISATYSISVYATATGHDNSDIVNATLCWIECDCSGNNTTGVINVPAKAVLVTSANGAVTVNCSLEGETVNVYATDGTVLGTAVIANGSATIQSGLSKGSVAIVKIGDKSVKVVVD